MVFFELLERFCCEQFMHMVSSKVVEKEESAFFRITEIDDSDFFCPRLFQIAGLCVGNGTVRPIGLETTRCISCITL